MGIMATNTLNAMTSHARIDEDVFRAVQGVGREVSPSELINLVQSRIDPSIVREAIWRLISDARIELTPDQTIRIVTLSEDNR